MPNEDLTMLYVIDSEKDSDDKNHFRLYTATKTNEPENGQIKLSVPDKHGTKEMVYPLTYVFDDVDEGNHRVKIMNVTLDYINMYDEIQSIYIKKRRLKFREINDMKIADGYYKQIDKLKKDMEDLYNSSQNEIKKEIDKIMVHVRQQLERKK